MKELKTRKNNKDVKEFLNSIEPKKKRDDSFIIIDLIKKITNEEPIMWGDSIIGFGDYSYSVGHNGRRDWFKLGYSPRKVAHTFYLMDGYDNYDIMSRLGKYKMSKVCLYIKKVKDIDVEVLGELIEYAYKSK